MIQRFFIKSYRFSLILSTAYLIIAVESLLSICAKKSQCTKNVLWLSSNTNKNDESISDRIHNRLWYNLCECL